MQQIIYFIKKFRYFLLFLVLETIAIFFTIQHHSYHKSKFINSANALSGGVYSKISSLSDFFNLKTENKLLIEENTKLKNLIANNEVNIDSFASINDEFVINNGQYNYYSGKIIKNDFTKFNNFLTLKFDNNMPIKPDMGVANSKGIIGVIKNVSNKYATVLSILNSYSNINVSLKNSDHFGTMTWNGKDYNTTQLNDIPRQAEIKKGDTIITGGMSVIFPKGIPVGIVKDFVFEHNQYQEINITLFNDMSALGYVYIIENKDKEEQLSLENEILNE